MSLEKFNAMPVSKAVVNNAVPAMLTMLMALIYNLADTLFIGLTHDAYQVAAISLTTPLFMMFYTLSLANSYLVIVAFSAPFTMISGTFSKILTAEGQPKKAMMGSMIMGVSVMFINNLMAGYGDMALAGSGVATKITMITGMLCIGIGQGVQPLLGYSIGEGNQKRYCATLKFSLVFAFIVGVIMTGICYLFMEQIIGVFLTDQDAYGYAFCFGRILLTTSSLFGIFYVLQNSLQAMGAALAALIIAVALFLSTYRKMFGKTAQVLQIGQCGDDNNRLQEYAGFRLE